MMIVLTSFKIQSIFHLLFFLHTNPQSSSEHIIYDIVTIDNSIPIYSCLHNTSHFSPVSSICIVCVKILYILLCLTRILFNLQVKNIIKLIFLYVSVSVTLRKVEVRGFLMSLTKKKKENIYIHQLTYQNKVLTVVKLLSFNTKYLNIYL